jgi:hypothetical protein
MKPKWVGPAAAAGLAALGVVFMVLALTSSHSSTGRIGLLQKTQQMAQSRSKTSSLAIKQQVKHIVTKRIACANSNCGAKKKLIFMDKSILVQCFSHRRSPAKDEEV